MSLLKVLRLDEYRDRRVQRLRLTEALYRPDPRRSAVFRHLTEVAELAGADRAAAVWVDEYGSGLVHPHVVLDQLSDRPRRTFRAEPLHEAWQMGVPSACDRLARPSSAAPASFAVSLGSDGTRAWFLVAESLAPRFPIEAAFRDRIMFLAGECAAVLLHRDLDALCDDTASGTRPRFAGWRILEDLDGREDDEHQSRCIAQRFVVARLVRMLVDDDLVMAPERMTEQVRRARVEIAEPASLEEVALWTRVLDCLEGGELAGLASTLVELGELVDGLGHAHGALELYTCAYHVAALLGMARPAAEALRLTGVQQRRQARWSDAQASFEYAHAIAEAGHMNDVLAHVLVGSAGIKREMGNLPAARQGFRSALSVAERCGDRDAIAVVHHALLGLEHQAGNLREALEHGWRALGTYKSELRRVRCMAGLGGVLTDCGDHEAAADAWTLVAHSSKEKYYLSYAYNALAHIAALHGQSAEFEDYARRCDELDWESGAKAAKAEILYYRGVSYLALGRPAVAMEWLERGLAFAEEHGFSRIIFRCEEALEAARRSEAYTEPAPAPAAPVHVREGLRAMRQELVGAGC
ncbi:MAG TPA: tetratricopeptide repeat protein [Longimicrobiales bacterium]|nr:tetratricopeptide repeat protein [Longimicrobiales bacterium]